GLNKLGHAFKIDLSEQTLLARASRQTGLDDWGHGAFRAGLRVLLEADQEAGLSSLGQLALRSEYHRLLTNRLRIQDAFKRHPPILDIPLRKPVFVVGFPRTGSTLLHNLLAQDPRTRVPLMWELLWPAPPLDGTADRRIRRAARCV